MLKELLDRVTEIGRNQAPAIVEAASEPDGSYYLRQPNGQLTLVKSENIYQPSAESVMDFMNVLEQYRKEKLEIAESSAAVFISGGRVTGLFELAGDRREFVTWDLVTTPAFKRAGELETRPSKLAHQEFLRLLRLHFTDCLPLGLYDQLRQVKFMRKDDAESGKSQGKVSIGKALQAEMAGADKIPEIVTLEMKVIERADFVGNIQSIRFDLDIDPSDGSFTFRPLAGELTEALFRVQRKLQENIVQRMQDLKIPGECVIGSP